MGAMPHAISNDAEHWLARAADARAMADMIIDQDAKRAMLDVAKDYERIAQRAKARQTPSLHLSNEFD
jgi:hypothetical protein